jgi:MFS family permease
MVGLTEGQLGLLYTLNGIMVVALQVPVTRVLSRWRFTTQLAVGAHVYAIAYCFVGICDRFELFVIAIILVTTGEIIMSPPALTLTSRLAPEDKMGRYMGIFGFFVTTGWSFGPLYGGMMLEVFGHNHLLAWSLIASLALLSGLGYLQFAKSLPPNLNTKPIP